MIIEIFRDGNGRKMKNRIGNIKLKYQHCTEHYITNSSTGKAETKIY